MIESKRFAYPFKKNFNGMLLRSVNVFAYFPVYPFTFKLMKQQWRNAMTEK